MMPFKRPMDRPAARQAAISQRQVGRIAGHDGGRDHGGQRDDGADRQVDTAKDHHQRHARGRDADGRRLPQDVEQVVRLGESRRDGKARSDRWPLSTKKIAQRDELRSRVADVPVESAIIGGVSG